MLKLEADPFTRVQRVGQLGEIITLLTQQRRLDGDERDQAVAELRAGLQYLLAPTLRQDLVDDLIVKHLKWILSESPPGSLVDYAADYLVWLDGALTPA